MKITYTPGDGDVQTWEFKPSKTMSAEAEAIEEQTGWTWDEFGREVMKGSMRARRALLWMLMRRDHPTLKFDDVSFRVDQFAAEFDVEELTELREITGRFADKAIRDQALAELDRQIAEAKGKTGPKAPAARRSRRATG